jgi:copper transport protein
VISAASTWRATPLDEFLEGSGSAVRIGERLELAGSLMSVPAILIIVGVVVFLATVFRGAAGEARLLVRVTWWAGALAVLGGSLETLGVYEILGVSWSDAIADLRMWSPLARLLAGALVLVGQTFELRRIGPAPSPGSSIRWDPGAGAAAGFVGILIGVFSFAFDGHTVTQGPRLAQALVDPIHVIAGGIWLGGVLALVAVGRLRRSRPSPPLGPLVVRFSAVATVALLVVAVAGVVMSALTIDDLNDYWTTTWGRVLLIKVFLVSLAAAVGGYNHFVIVPALESDPDDAQANHRSRTTLAVEALMLVCVALVTVLLTRASIN